MRPFAPRAHLMVVQQQGMRRLLVGAKLPHPYAQDTCDSQAE